MISVYSQALSLLAAHSGPGNILHIGAGRGDEVADYRSTNARRIILVEPLPEFVQQLAVFAATDPRIVVKEVAVSTATARGQLSVFNLSDLSSLRPPRGAKKIFPGLRVVSTIDVATTTLSSLIAELPPADSSKPDLLVVSAPGEEATIVDALLDHPDGHRFGAVLLRAAAEAGMFEASRPFEEITDRLRAVGYQFRFVDMSDPDRPCVLMLHDSIEQKAAARVVSHQLDTLNTRCDALQDENAALAMQVERLVAIEDRYGDLLRDQQAQEKDKAESAAAHNKEVASVKAQMEVVEAERTQLQDALAQERSTSAVAREKLSKLSEVRDSFLRERDEARERCDVSQSEIEALEARLSAVISEQAQLASELNTERSASVLFREELSKLAGENASLLRERDVSVSEVVTLTDRLNAAEAERVQLSVRFAKERSEAESVFVFQIATLTKQYEALQAEHSDLALQVEGQQAEIEDRHLQLVSAAQAHEEEKLALNVAAEAHLATERDVMTRERDEAYVGRDAALSEVAAQMSRLETVEAESRKFSEALTGERSRCEALQQELADVSEARELLTDRLNVAEAEQAQLSKALADERDASEAARQELTQLSEARDALSRERDEARAERDAMRLKVTEVSEARDSLWRERDDARARRDASIAEVAGITTRLSKAEAEQSRLSEAVAQGQSSAEAARQKLTEVSEARDALWRERDQARAERDAASEQVKTLDRRARDLEFRLGLAREEFHRSEGQLALIKDLLLREGGL